MSSEEKTDLIGEETVESDKQENLADADNETIKTDENTEEISDNGSQKDSEVTENDEPEIYKENSAYEELKKEVDTLRDELNKEKNKLSGFVNQLKELYELYPDADINSISDDIWKGALTGTPVAAAYALYQRRCEVAKQRASETNKQNREKCVGGIAGNNDNGYFSPSEVRNMTPTQVRENYTKIIDSMNHWN